MSARSSKQVTVSIRIPKELHDALRAYVGKGKISSFITEAIVEKLERSPRPDRILELEGRIDKLEASLAELRKLLASLELLSFKRGEVDPFDFCSDELDRKIVTYLIQHRGATAPELATELGVDRWRVLYRLKRIQQQSAEKLGRAIVEFEPGEREGKKRAWWLLLE